MSRESRVVSVSALPFRMQEDALRALFEPYGSVHSVTIHADWLNPSREPCAQIQMENAGDAIRELDGKQVGLTHLRVNELITVGRDGDELQRY